LKQEASERSDVVVEGEEVVPSCGGGWPQCAACQQLERACRLECVFAPYFPSDDDPAGFLGTMAVHAAFGAEIIS
jgi:hypothetical protein